MVSFLVYVLIYMGSGKRKGGISFFSDLMAILEHFLYFMIVYLFYTKHRLELILEHSTSIIFYLSTENTISLFH